MYIPPPPKELTHVHLQSLIMEGELLIHYVESSELDVGFSVLNEKQRGVGSDGE